MNDLRDIVIYLWGVIVGVVLSNVDGFWSSLVVCFLGALVGYIISEKWRIK